MEVRDARNDAPLHLLTNSLPMHPPSSPPAPRGAKRKHSDQDDPASCGADAFDPATRAKRPSSSSLSTTSTTTTSEKSRKHGGGDFYYKQLYAADPDFSLLAQRDADLAPFVKRDDSRSRSSSSSSSSASPDGRRDGRREPTAHIDFTDPAAVMQLAKTQLKLDFDLNVEFRDDRLCPPIPNRHNYILWLKSLVDSTSPWGADACDPARPVTGIDIGTGSSAIYPLLGCAQRPRWSFVATELDPVSLESARDNVARNPHVASRIRIVDATPNSTLIPSSSDDLGGEHVHVAFTMCNPPFYASAEEQADLAAAKALPPSGACTGAPVEMIYEGGGEVAFVTRMMDESTKLCSSSSSSSSRWRDCWFTSMLGRQSSLEALVPKLKERGVRNYAAAAFIQGRRTRRWALGWSHGPWRPRNSVCRGGPSGDDLTTMGKAMLPNQTELLVTWDLDLGRRRGGEAQSIIEAAICETIKEGDFLCFTWDGERSRGVGCVDGNVWSRAYRRKKAREMKQHQHKGDGELMTPSPTRQQHHNNNSSNSDDNTAQTITTTTNTTKPGDMTPGDTITKCAFAFALTVRVHSRSERSGLRRFHVMVRWLKGGDYTLFESFTGAMHNGELRASITRKVQQEVHDHD